MFILDEGCDLSDYEVVLVEKQLEAYLDVLCPFYSKFVKINTH